ncbi:hypothetical protein [Streptomyces reticuli]|uniref:hypothetical protein n=1 Tax=Streptomyces reticuli TaxID=1926 RepID=UPI00073E0F91|nr:hypothetical protein TUE45_pSRTUE45b_0080 [Streptomyces reticuli]
MRLPRFVRAVAVLLPALLAPAVPAAAHAETPTAPATAAQRHTPGHTITLPVRDALAALPVQDESRAGYTRDKFKHWTDADKDGCNTRAEVLLAEAVNAPTAGPRCPLTGGAWYSPYDDQYYDNARQLDVDQTTMWSGSRGDPPELGGCLDPGVAAREARRDRRRAPYPAGAIAGGSGEGPEGHGTADPRVVEQVTVVVDGKEEVVLSRAGGV